MYSLYHVIVNVELYSVQIFYTEQPKKETNIQSRRITRRRKSCNQCVPFSPTHENIFYTAPFESTYSATRTTIVSSVSLVSTIPLKICGRIVLVVIIALFKFLFNRCALLLFYRTYSCAVTSDCRIDKLNVAH